MEVVRCFVLIYLHIQRKIEMGGFDEMAVREVAEGEGFQQVDLG